MRQQPSSCTPLCFIQLLVEGSTAAVSSCRSLWFCRQACLGVERHSSCQRLQAVCVCCCRSCWHQIFRLTLGGCSPPAQISSRLTSLSCVMGSPLMDPGKRIAVLMVGWQCAS